MDYLPVEIIVEIFKHLNGTDRKFAGRVCSKWLEASSHPTFLNKTEIVIRKLNDKSIFYRDNIISPDPLKVFLNSQRKFKRYFLSNIDLDGRNFSLFWKRNASNIQSLAILDCPVRSTTLAKILQATVNLKHLDVEIRDYEIIHSWSAKDFRFITTNIQSFRWNIQYFRDDLFNAMLKMMPKLNAVVLGGVPLGAHFSAEKTQLYQKNTLTVMNFEEILKTQGPYLKELEIHGLQFPFPLIQKLLDSNVELNLHTFTLINFLQNVSLDVFLKKQITLKKLNLRAVWFDDQTLQVISEMKGLESLQLLLQRDQIVTDESFMLLNKLTSLKELKLSNFTNTNQGFNLGIGRLNLSKLVTLELVNFINVSSDAVVNIISRASNLRALHVLGSNITNGVLQEIFHHAVHIETFLCFHAPKITDAGFLGKTSTDRFKINRCRNLQTLVLRLLPNLSDKCLQAVSCGALAVLKIVDCPKVTLAGLKALILNCPALEIIELQEMYQIQINNLVSFGRLHMKRFKYIHYN